MSKFEPLPGASARNSSGENEKRIADGTLRPVPTQGRRPKRWKLVGNDALERAVNEAFVTVAEREVGGLDGLLLARLQSGFLIEFRKRIKGGGRSLRAVSKKDFLEELEQSNSELLAKRDGTLAKLRDLEDKVKAIEAGDASALGSADGLRPAEVRARVLKFLETRLRAARTRDEFGRGLLEFSSALLREDRERRGLDGEDGLGGEALDRYRRRIDKLRSALSDTEEQLEELARRAREGAEPEHTGQLNPILIGRESKEERLAMMQRLFEQNLALRDSLRAAKGVSA